MAVEYDPKTITGAYGIGSETIDPTVSAKDVAARNAEMKTALEAISEPLQAFAILCAYFSGQQFRIMEEKITEYEEKKNEYEKVLTTSQEANIYLAEAKKDDETEVELDFMKNMKWILEGTGKTQKDVSKDYKFDKDEAQNAVDLINRKKDILSTDLQALSTEVDMTVQDQSEAEEMAANSVKKLVDLLSAIGRTAGG